MRHAQPLADRLKQRHLRRIVLERAENPFTLRVMSEDAREESHFNQAYGAIAPCAPATASRASLWRARKLFDLAVTASGAAPGSVARAIGLDLRAIENMRELPTVGAIARIASALGLDLAAAVEVVGTGTDADRPIDAANGALMLHALLEADLDDDAIRLERLANDLADDPDRPQHFGLAVLLGARAAAARGQVAEAMQRLRFSQHFPGYSLSLPCVPFLAECMQVEALLGSPWDPLRADWIQRSVELGSVDWEGTRTACGAGDASPAHASAMAARSAACAHVRSLFLALARDSGRTAEAFDALRASIEGPGESPAGGAWAHSAAWRASLAGIAALRAIETTRLSARGERTAIELLVQSQFALDETIATRSAGQVMALLRRRARLALHEWCDRARRGELPNALLDELDVQEVRTIFVRFPGARRGALAEIDLHDLRARAV
jgi:hypothetical protein